MEKTDENFWLVVGQGISPGSYMLVQEGKVLAPSLKGDVHLLESYAIFPSTSGGWSGSYYFSIAAHEQLELKLASFQERGCSQIFLWSLMLDLSSARESTHLYPS